MVRREGWRGGGGEGWRSGGVEEWRGGGVEGESRKGKRRLRGASTAGAEIRGHKRNKMS